MNTRIVKRLVPALLLIASFVGAQESGPAEPVETEIIIPDFVLQVEELTVEEVEAVLPEEEDLALGRIELPLPGAGELSVADIAFDVPLPSMVGSRPRSNVFSTGRLGAGTMNRIVGELSIYKLGEDPRFRLGFTHEGLDGYQFKDAGTGFSDFTNTIDAWISTTSDTLDFELEGTFAEDEQGLQDLSQYGAVSIRSTGVSVDTVFHPDPLIALTGGVDAGLATRRQRTTGGLPVPVDTEYTLEPAASARLDIRSLGLLFSTSYYLRLMESVPTQQDMDFAAGFELSLPISLVIGGQAGVHWDFSTGLNYPWQLSVRGLIGDALELGASGGFRVDRVSFTDLWAIDPLIAIGDIVAPAELLNNNVWFVDADARWTGTSGFSARTGVTFTSESATVDLQPYNATTDEFPYYHRAFNRLIPSINAAWQPSPILQVEGGLSGSFLDRTTIEPTVAADGTIRVSSRNEVVQASLQVKSNFFPEPDIPWLGLETTISAAEGVDVVIELSDLLAPINDTGRAVHGPSVTAEYPFIEPGFVATILTRITL